MATINDPNNALQQLAYRLNDASDPDDDGLLAEVGKGLLDTAQRVAAKVRETNKAAKGEVVLRFKIGAHRTKNNEVAVEFEPLVTTKMPELTKARGIQFFAGHEGELSTQPVQEEMGPLFNKDTARSIEGGKSDEKTEKKGKKAI
jgi:hypothetical protein